MNFNSRETYLAAVVEWKAEYAALTNQIRATRKQFNEAQKTFSKSSTREGTYWPAWKEVERLRGEREGLRAQANNLLSDRFTMKQEAQRQYLEQRKAPSTCDYQS